MDYEALYKSKLTTAEEAAKVVKSGDWVDYGWTTTTPVAFDAALAPRMANLENVNFRGGILMWEPEIFKKEKPLQKDSLSTLLSVTLSCHVTIVIWQKMWMLLLCRSHLWTSMDTLTLDQVLPILQRHVSEANVSLLR